MPVHQLLVYPFANFAYDTPSYQENLKTVPLNKGAMEWFGKYYLRTSADAANPLASPLRAKSFAGLPAATIINAEIDRLRDDGAEYANKLKAAGVPVTRTLYPASHMSFSALASGLRNHVER